MTAEEMREVDRLLKERFAIDLLQMMELAGLELARLVRGLMVGSIPGSRIVVAAGRGNNGGGGLAAARHLHNWGAEVKVFLQTEALSGAPLKQLQALKVLQVEILTAELALRAVPDLGAHVIVDALIGYGLSGRPRGWVAQMIEAINLRSLPVVALDIPSGLDASTGEAYEPCMRATATLTLALPKTGLVEPGVEDVVGSLYLADIGVPAELYGQMGMEMGPLFAHDTIILLAGPRHAQAAGGLPRCPTL